MDSIGCQASILSSIYFMKKDGLHETEKPYAFHYAVLEDVAQTNMLMEKISNIPITNIRGRESDFVFEKDGF
jgi:hypothetical protein